MYRTNNCGELKISDVGKTVTLAGWVQKIRNKGFLIWIDLRDRYGITQLIINSEKSSKKVIESVKDKQATEKELIDFCKETLANFKVPKKIEFCELPKTSTGKIQKFELKEK